MAKPVVFVIGASGNIGLASLQSLSSLYSNQLEIRAGVRDPDKAEKVKALPGVIVVKAIQGDKEQLVKIFTEVNCVFIVTPPTENRAELAIKTAEAAKEAGVEHLLVVSVPLIELTDIIVGKQFKELEESISKLGVPYTFLRLPMFTESYFRYKQTIQKMSTIITPLDPTKPYTSVVVAEAGKAAAAILADCSKHINKVYTIVSNRHTFNDVAKAFSEALGREVTITTSTYEDTERSLSGLGILQPWLIQSIIEMYKAVDTGLAPSETTSHYKDITGEDPTSLKDWVNAVAPAFK